MKKKPVTQDFEMTLGEFFTQMMTKLGFIKRDKAEFEKQGVTDEKITEVETMLVEYSNFSTDDELIGLQMNATEEKNKVRDILRSNISEVVDRAASKYETDSGYYRQFGVKTLSATDGGELAATARRVYRVGTNMAAELTSEGLTQEMLDNLKTNTDTFDKVLAAQEDAIANREIAVEDRIEKANAIYALMVKYCEKGKRIWISTNQARYNDYVIYDTPSGKPDNPTPPKA